MEFIWMLIIGLVVRVIAKFRMTGRDPGGFIITILLGIGGVLFPGFPGRVLDWYQSNDPAGYLASVVGAIILLIVYRLATRKLNCCGAGTPPASINSPFNCI